eukprot:COSAG02_NODE_12654_length_1513_cov_7.202970_2_plen_278_part_01
MRRARRLSLTEGARRRGARPRFDRNTAYVFNSNRQHYMHMYLIRIASTAPLTVIALPTTARTVLTAPERLMSADRVNLPTPTSPGSTPGAAGFSAATSAASTSAAPPPQQPLGAARATDPAAAAPAAAAVALRLRAMLPQVDPELAAPVAQASAATPLADLKREVERILSPRDDGDGAAATADENAGKYQGKLGSLTFTLGRHDEVQETALRPTLKTNGFLVSSSKTSELRKPGDANDFSRKKGDLSTIGLFHEAKDILDIGITHPTIDSSLNTLSSV